MLRDQNATRSFDIEHLEMIESLFVEMKLFLIRLTLIKKFFLKTLNEVEANKSRDFFDDLRFFIKCEEMKSIFEVKESQLPRLNTWDKSKGVLSFLIVIEPA